MQRILIVAAVATATALLAGCSEDKTTGYACLGADNDSRVENIQEHCKAGDAIATKHRAYFCDFNYAVTYNGFNSALCIYTGQQATERVQAEKPGS
jgi:outer membrane murein-binding lipoprotein Lpp